MQKRNGFMRIGLRISGTVSSMNTEMQASRIKLRDNAARFKQEKKIIQYLLVRKRQESEPDIGRVQTEEEEVAGDNEGVETETGGGR